MDAAEKLEMIREKFNLTESDPIPEHVINTWILSTPQVTMNISVVEYNCKYDTNKLSSLPLSGNMTRFGLSSTLEDTISGNMIFNESWYVLVV